VHGVQCFLWQPLGAAEAFFAAVQIAVFGVHFFIDPCSIISLLSLATTGKLKIKDNRNIKYLFI
jgi:hypothetical protein